MKCNAEFGDYVELILSNEKHKGIYLENENKSLVFLKLDNGYNIGFDKKEILDIRKIKEINFRKESRDFKMDSSKPNIAMIITGGTIASKVNPKKGGVDFVKNPKDLFQYYPGVFNDVNVVIDIPFMKNSPHMDYKDWQNIAKVCEKYLNDKNISGIILTQGTDTLHYTSSALSFFLGKVNKPVILTYSQRSIDRASSDANFNLKCSLRVALSEINEVVVVGHGSDSDDYCNVIRGTRVRKLHSSRRDAFKSVNSLPLAKAHSERIEFLSEYFREQKKSIFIDSMFDSSVALVKFYPGQSSDILDYYLEKGYKGVVLEVFGLGHVSTKDSRNNWLPKLKEVQKKGLIVCASAQTIFGRVDPMVYSYGRDLLETGIIYLEDMLSETALVKLGWVLGHKDWAKSREIVREKMLHNFVGEISERLVE